MLNRSGINKTTATSPVQILASVDLQYSVGCIVGKDLGVEVGNKKIVKAGTPINIDPMNTGNAVKKADTTNAMNGVLLHDVEVTNGAANGTALLMGVVNTNAVESDVKTLLTTAVSNDNATKTIILVAL